MARVFNFPDDDHDDNVHAFLLTHFYDFEKTGYVFDHETAVPFAKLTFNSGDTDICFYELTDGRLAWYDECCGELVVTEKPMDIADLLIELKKLVK
jgi:hypothetical protein